MRRTLPGYAAGVADDIDDDDRIVGILATGNSHYTGAQILDMLHTAGFRVVRAGMVPKFDDIDAVARMLDVLRGVSGFESASAEEINDASGLLTGLREAAMGVLRIGPGGLE